MAEQGGLETPLSREVFPKENPRNCLRNFLSRSANIVQREIVRHSQLAFENVVREFGLKSNSGPRILSAPLNIGDNCFCPSEKIGIDDQAGG